MTFHGQLGLSQNPGHALAPWLLGPEFRDGGLLGNKDIQTPQGSACAVDLAAKIANAEPTPVDNEPLESGNMGWLVRNAEELGRHKGEWLLIHQERLRAHDRDFAAIREAIRRDQIVAPFVYYVPTDEESNSVTI